MPLNCRACASVTRAFSLDNVSFAVPEGKIVGLVGENGAGKTTIIRSIMGSCRIDSGRITVLFSVAGIACSGSLAGDAGFYLLPFYAALMLLAHAVAMLLLLLMSGHLGRSAVLIVSVLGIAAFSGICSVTAFVNMLLFFFLQHPVITAIGFLAVLAVFCASMLLSIVIYRGKDK